MYCMTSICCPQFLIHQEICRKLKEAKKIYHYHDMHILWIDDRKMLSLKSRISTLILVVHVLDFSSNHNVNKKKRCHTIFYYYIVI